MVSGEATAVQRYGQLSVREPRTSQPHFTAAAGERGFVQWKGRWKAFFMRVLKFALQ
jgi:hypothetical protein